MAQNLWGQIRSLNDQGVLANIISMGIGKRIFLDPVNGNDNNDGMAPASVLGSNSGAVATLAAAYALATAGNNDIIFLVSNGATASSARLSATFTWAKNATHLIGYCAPTLFSQRARIAPPTVLAAAAGNTPFFTISASGCMFMNVEWYVGFSTGQAAQIGLLITGDQNYFKNCHIAGIADAASAADAGSRSLKLSSSDECLFEDCVIGVDTVARGAVANASLELAAGSARNVFRRCSFPFFTTNAAPLGILGTGAACCDRFNVFDMCTFLNAIKSSSVQMTALLSFTSAAPGGAIIFKDCSMIGVTKFGDTNGLANSYLDMAAVSGSAGGLMVVPS